MSQGVSPKVLTTLATTHATFATTCTCIALPAKVWLEGLSGLTARILGNVAYLKGVPWVEPPPAQPKY